MRPPRRTRTIALIILPFAQLAQYYCGELVYKSVTEE